MIRVSLRLKELLQRALAEEFGYGLPVSPLAAHCAHFKYCCKCKESQARPFLNSAAYKLIEANQGKARQSIFGSKWEA